MSNYDYTPIERTEEQRAASFRRAMDVWEEAIGQDVTLVKTYLRSRAITLPIPNDIRFHGGVWQTEWGGYQPAMVALIRAGDDIGGVPIGVHITWLLPDGRDKAVNKPNKKTWGVFKGRGGAIRLCPVAEEMAFGEGIETCLSYMQMTGTPTWAAGTSNGLKYLKLPTAVRRVILLADNKTTDDPGPAACRKVHQRLAMGGLRVRIVTAPKGTDFNDVLRGK